MQNDRELLESLRALASDGPQQAPLRIERRLQTEFQKRTRWRRARIWTSFAGAAAIAAGIALSLWIHAAPQAHVQPAPAAVYAVQASDDDSDAAFYPLPEAEALPALENAMVVRVQLPVSSLRLMGVPVDMERDDTAVQAELLLGQDGLARGVRLVE